MRKYILLIVSIAFTFCAFGQTKLTFERNAFTVGDNHDFYLAKTADEGKTGANITWDFSSLVPSGNLTSHMIDPATTPKGSSVTDANLALVEDGNIFYFKVTSEGMEQFGTAVGTTLSTYTDPFVKIKYPFSFGDVATGNFSAKLETPNAPAPTSGSFKVEGDAWGTLILPNGVYKNALRVKQTRIYNLNDTTNKEITYRWYTSSVRYPLLVIIKFENQCKTTIAKVAYYAHSPNEKITPSTTPNSFPGAAEGIEAYPNPITDELNVNYQVNATAKVSIDLYDASGGLIRNFLSPVTKEPGKYSDKFNLSSNLPSGNYFVKATIGDQNYIKKIIKVNNQ